MKESLGVRFLYQTVIGRSILKLLVKPKISRAAGKADKRKNRKEKQKQLSLYIWRKHNGLY